MPDWTSWYPTSFMGLKLLIACGNSFVKIALKPLSLKMRRILRVRSSGSAFCRNGSRIWGLVEVIICTCNTFVFSFLYYLQSRNWVVDVFFMIVRWDAVENYMFLRDSQLRGWIVIWGSSLEFMSLLYSLQVQNRTTWWLQHNGMTNSEM